MEEVKIKKSMKCYIRADTLQREQKVHCVTYKVTIYLGIKGIY